MTKRVRAESDEEENIERNLNNNTTSNDYGNQRQKLQEFSKKGTIESIAGTIESITLNNFMCHEHVRINFTGLITFIIGNNGSGKSAILTAIMVCLGVKTSFTQRASTLKTLIKEGQSAALVTLVLNNRGENSYKPHIYGETISIERRITHESNGFKIKSATGKIISTKKEELVNICDYLRIQADNPIIILSQENAKKFIGTATPNDKYLMFLKATHLGQLSEDLKLITELTHSTSKIVEDKVSTLPELRQELKDAEVRYKSLEKAHTLHSTIQNLKNQMAWAQVAEAEEAEGVLKKKKEEILDKIELVKNKIKEKDDEIERIKAEAEQANKNIEVYLKRGEVLRLELIDEKRRGETINSGLEDAYNAVNDITDSIKRNKHEIDDLTNKINEESNKTKNGDNKKAASEQKKETIKLSISEHQREIEQLNDKVQQTETKINAHSSQIEPLENRLRNLQSQAYQLEEQKRKFEAQKRNELSVFGDNISLVLMDIEKEKSWHTKPIGPFGRFIKIKEIKWAKTIESVLGSTLDSFMVSNYKDQKTLSKILEKRGCFNRIFVSKMDKFDYSNGEPDVKFLTILRNLEFDNEMIKLQMINFNRIEKTILIEDRNQANEIMYKPPKNVAFCFTVDGFQIGSKGGGYSTIALNLQNGPSRLIKSTDHMLHNLNSKYQECQSAISNIREEKKGLDQYVSDLKTELQTLKRKGTDLKIKIRDLEREIQAIDMEITDDEPANIIALEEARETKIKERNLMIEQFKSLTAVHKEEQEKYNQHLSMMSSIKEKTKVFKSGLQKLEEVKEKKNQIVIQMQQISDRLVLKLKEYNERSLSIEFNWNEIKEQIEKKTLLARDYCPERPVITAPPDELDKNIKRLQMQLEKAQQMAGITLEECFDDLEAKRHAYKKARTDTANMQKFIEDLSSALEDRKQRWEHFKVRISKRIRNLFRYQLSHRGFKGRLEIDHQNRRLMPCVHVDKGQDLTEYDNNNPRTLSGGERSYSTICLLLALWESVDCPIRCLDEFDVFMDSMTRKVSAEMLINFARLTKRVQYILITPQSIGNIDISKDVCVHRMFDPRPNDLNQQRLNLERINN